MVFMAETSESVLRESAPAATGKSWGSLSIHAYVKIGVIAALFYSLFHVEIDKMVSEWINNPSWSHGFLIPCFSLYFINQRKEEILGGQPKPSYIGLVLLVCGILFYPLNIAHFQIGYFRPIGMIVTLWALVLFQGGWRLMKYLWLPVLFLLFAVPLPNEYYFQLTDPMQKLAAAVAAAMLSLVNSVEATASGVVINVIHNGQVVDPPLNVAEACSGMRLLMAFVALGVAMAYLHYRPLWQRLILVASTIPIAILCNMVRVSTTGFIYIFGNPKYAQGIYHDALGMAMLPLAFCLYGVIAWFMSSLFVEEDEEPSADVIERRNPN